MVRSNPGVCWPIAALVLLACGEAGARTATSLTLSGAGNYVVIPDHRSLNPVGGITLEAWVRPTSRDGFPTIWGKTYSSAQWLGLASGRLRFYPSGSGSFMDGSSALPLGVWSHVAVTYVPSTGRRVYYINGNVDLDTTSGGPRPLGLNTSDIGIGAEASGAFPFSGNLAEVRIWRHARSRAEIRRDMWRQLGAEAGSDLLGAWPLDGSAGDALGRNPGSTRGSAFFGSPSAPPTMHQPAHLPLLVVAPTIDGICDESEYGLAQGLPVWFDADPTGTSAYGSNPELVKVGASSGYLYVCLGPRGIPPWNWIEVYVDGNASGGSLPAAGDYRFRLYQDGTSSAAQGIGSLGWLTTSVSGFLATRSVFGEFDQSFELRIPRSLITSADGVFRLQIAEHHELVASGPIYSQGWPDDQILSSPSTFERAVINASTTLPADSTAPHILGVRVTPGERPTTEQPVSVEVVASDGYDLQAVEIWIDGSIARVCDAPGSADVLVPCNSPATLLALGPHLIRARAVDQVGRVASHLLSIRVMVDGQVPVLDLGHAPLEPTPGGGLTISASATDPSGITRISVAAHGAASRTCTFGGSSTTESCALAVPTSSSSRVVRYSASASDLEGLSAASSVRTVLVGNTGPDRDGDGIDDSHEGLLCTSSALVDSDNDALGDGWEILGVPDASGSSILVDLPALGADPCTKDVFMQYDYEEGARVDAGVLEPVIQAFRRHGVDLHVEEHERPRLDDGAFAPNSSAAASYQTAENDGQFWFAPERNWTHYYTFSKHSIGRSAGGDRQFSYDIYVRRLGTCMTGSTPSTAVGTCNTDANCPAGSSCVGVCSCPTDGSVDPDACRGGVFNCFREPPDAQSRRFMHELGHALGLSHGGRIGNRTLQRNGEYIYYGGGGSSTAGDGINFKPNYMSAMNYDSDGGELCWTPAGAPVSEIDYSDEVLGPLQENGLDEAENALSALPEQVDCSHAVAGSVPGAHYTCIDPDEPDVAGNAGQRRFLMVTDGTRTLARRSDTSTWDLTPPAHDPGVDFDCDGVIEDSVQSNLNGDGGESILPPEGACDGLDNDSNGVVDEGCAWNASERLTSNDDWLHIPSPPACQIPYDDTAGCYWWPEVYRLGVGSHGVDCRPAGRPTVQCPSWPGILSSGRPIEEPRDADLRVPPGTEFCDGYDNDHDEAIDEGCRDQDADGLSDSMDNCPLTSNANQADLDRDQLGDACEARVPVQPRVIYTGPNGTGLGWPAAGELRGYNVYCELPGRGAAAFMGDAYPSTPIPSFNIPPVGGHAGRYLCWVAPVDLRGDEGAWSQVEVVTEHDGDAFPDDVDLCPYWASASQIDSDGNGIGDECECGDQTEDGTVNVQDLVGINRAIFGADPVSPLCDTNADGKCDVLDIVGANARIYGQPAYCSRYPPPSSGE